MIQYFVDDPLVFDARDDLDGSATARTGLHVDVEYAPESPVVTEMFANGARAVCLHASRVPALLYGCSVCGGVVLGDYMILFFLN